MVNKTKICSFLFVLWGALPASAAQLDMNTAQMQALDKITGRVNIINVPVGGEVAFGSFSVVVRACKTRTEDEIPENFAFVDVADKDFSGQEQNIFKGWMFSSSPAVHAVEHPIYDVWLLRCINTDVKPEALLSAEALAQRDILPQQVQNQPVQELPQINEMPLETEQNIQIKEASYQEEQTSQTKPEYQEPDDGKPQNLLRIDEEFLRQQNEESISLPADEFSKAIASEAAELKREEQEQKELNEAIDAELARQNETN